MPKTKRESKREPGVNEITKISHQAGEDARAAKKKRDEEFRRDYSRAKATSIGSSNTTMFC